MGPSAGHASPLHCALLARIAGACRLDVVSSRRSLYLGFPPIDVSNVRDHRSLYIDDKFCSRDVVAPNFLSTRVDMIYSHANMPSSRITQGS
jgi:hypothetical protein